MSCESPKQFCQPCRVSGLSLNRNVLYYWLLLWTFGVAPWQWSILTGTLCGTLCRHRCRHPSLGKLKNDPRGFGGSDFGATTGSCAPISSHHTHKKQLTNPRSILHCQPKVSIIHHEFHQGSTCHSSSGFVPAGKCSEWRDRHDWRIWLQRVYGMDWLLGNSATPHFFYKFKCTKFLKLNLYDACERGVHYL